MFGKCLDHFIDSTIGIYTAYSIVDQYWKFDSWYFVGLLMAFQYLPHLYEAIHGTLIINIGVFGIDEINCILVALLVGCYGGLDVTFHTHLLNRVPWLNYAPHLGLLMMVYVSVKHLRSTKNPVSYYGGQLLPLVFFSWVFWNISGTTTSTPAIYDPNHVKIGVAYVGLLVVTLVYNAIREKWKKIKNR